MANWLSLKQLSEKRGIAESTLRGWKSLGYIETSTIDNVVMIDDESLTRFLNTYQTSSLNEEYLKELIKEKEREREVILSYYDDTLFLLKTHELYQPLFHILIKELGALITDAAQRELFLSISSGELISRVAVRHGITYSQAVKKYSSILKSLSGNTERIATYRRQRMTQLFGKYNTPDPTSISLSLICNTRACKILQDKEKIETVRELLQYTSKNGWSSLKQLRGMGNTTYNHIIDSLCKANFIVKEKEEVKLSPEISTLLIE